MIMTGNKSYKQVLNELKVEYAVKQKKGLPFIMASAALWTIMLIAFLTDLDLAVKNMIAMYCFVWKINRSDIILKQLTERRIRSLFC